MKKFYKKYKRLIGVFFLLLAILFFVFWEFIGRNELLNETIVVLTQDVYKGDFITEEMLATSKISANNYIENAIRDKNQIIGLEAKQYIPSKAQLVSEYFDKPELILNKDQKIMKIPDEWLHSFPETLRRKDTVYLYAIKNQDDNTTEVENSAKQVDNSTVNTKNDSYNKKLFVLSTVVAYVKDNTNREVESLDANRLVGSSSISNVEIIITDKEFKILKGYAESGYTFALLYQ